MDNEKFRLEKAAIELFIKRYNSYFDDDIELVRQEDKPDAVLRDSKGHSFGVEIAHLYLNDKEAMYTLNRTKKGNGCIDSHGYIKPLTKLLLDKASKIPKYNVSFPVDLLIRSASPLLTIETIQGYRNEIIIPSCKVIRNVWLLLDNNKSTERWTDLIKLYNDSE